MREEEKGGALSLSVFKVPLVYIYIGIQGTASRLVVDERERVVQAPLAEISDLGI